MKNESIEDLILYENENTNLDFKEKQYLKKQHGELIKDVLSMANAHSKVDRYIVLGVRHKSSGKREIIGINNQDFIDSSTYEQLILENITPGLLIDYSPYIFKEKKLGIIKIPSKCYFNRPYLVKKKNKIINEGEIRIRKGSSTHRATREDIDKMYKARSEIPFEGKVKITFSNCNKKNIELPICSNLILPSKVAYEEISKIIEKKKKIEENCLFEGTNLLSEAFRKIENVSYFKENKPNIYMSLEELQKIQSDVEKNYKEVDEYTIFKASHKININVLNEGNNYIEDASIEVKINTMKDLYISPIFAKKPLYFPFGGTVPSFYEPNYPKVTSTESSICIFQKIGDIKHHIPRDLFEEPFRMVLFEESKSKTIHLKCILYGKNLPKPLQEFLKINVVPNKK